MRWCRRRRLCRPCPPCPPCPTWRAHLGAEGALAMRAAAAAPAARLAVGGSSVAGGPSPPSPCLCHLARLRARELVAVPRVAAASAPRLLGAAPLRSERAEEGHVDARKRARRARRQLLGRLGDFVVQQRGGGSQSLLARRGSDHVEQEWGHGDVALVAHRPQLGDVFAQNQARGAPRLARSPGRLRDVVAEPFSFNAMCERSTRKNLRTSSNRISIQTEARRTSVQQ